MLPVDTRGNTHSVKLPTLCQALPSVNQAASESDKEQQAAEVLQTKVWLRPGLNFELGFKTTMHGTESHFSGFSAR